MSTTSPVAVVEVVPLLWSAELDEPFFRITATSFSADFCLGASVMLAGNDAE